MATNAMLHDSGQVEWYTPENIVEAARRCMGGIDLDPASSEAANVIVSATRYYTVADDGLSLPWYGLVWMNHPYSKINNLRWIPKLIAEYRSGNVTQACMICFASTSEGWFQPLYDFPICFTNKRIPFTPGSGQRESGSQKGSAIVYLGPNVDRFAAAFHGLGRVMLPYRIPDTKCAVCDRGFRPKRRDGLYCSAACKQKAVRQRVKESE